MTPSYLELCICILMLLLCLTICDSEQWWELTDCGGKLLTVQDAWERPGPEVIKNFMLNLAENEIFPAHKC